MRYLTTFLPAALLVAISGCSDTIDASDKPVELPEAKVDLPPGESKEPRNRSIVLAGGCFWCTEAVFEELDGVKSVVSGYAGGSETDADYRKVAAGKTDHAEAIKIVYDPRKITYAKLLQVFFSVAHDPTQKNRQGPDRGRQYRSAIFYANAEQKRVAAAYIKQLEGAKVFDKPIVTTLEPLGEFYPAEKHHQDFTKRNPWQPYIRRYSIPKVRKVRKAFPKESREE